MGLDIYLLSTIYPIISSYSISTDQAVREFLWCEERIYPITYAIWSDKSVLNAQNFIGVQVFIESFPTGNIHLKLVDHSHFGPNFPILIFFPFSIFHRSVPTLCKPKFSMKIIQN